MRRPVFPSALVLVLLTGCRAEAQLGDDDSASSEPTPEPSPAPCGSEVALDDRTVRTTAGVFRGTVEGGSLKFLGIPYAAPPVGDQRFRPPTPAPCVEEVRDANAHPPLCPQLDADGVLVGNEDCLQLDLYLPSGTVEPKAGRPVLFFVHGGGNTQGGATVVLNNGDLLYDGASLAERFGSIVVVAQYRLGALGFLTHPDLDAERQDQGLRSGNDGLRDQQLALRWVQEEISAFGGDPTSVLLFGESAGALDTCAHLVAPTSHGLFSAALMQSGGCPEARLAEVQIDHWDRVTQAGCTDDDVLSCLRGLDLSALVAMAGPVFDGPVVGQDGFGPVVDGELLPDGFREAASAAALAPVPLILGANEDEMAQRVPVGVTEEDYVAFVTAHYGLLADELLSIYAVDQWPTPRLALIALTTDLQFVCPARRIARAVADAGLEPVRRYHFALGIDPPGPQPAAAFHGLELAYVFQRLDGLSAGGAWSPGDADIAVEAALGQWWTSFAADGAPSGDGLPDWTTYDPPVDNTMRLGAEISMVSGIHTERCNAVDALLD